MQAARFPPRSRPLTLVADDAIVSRQANPGTLMAIHLDPEQNSAGDPAVASQGFGRIDPNPAPRFHFTDVSGAAAFFAAEGYVVLDGALSQDEVRHLNDFCDRTQITHATAWGLGNARKPHHRNQGLIYSQPLLDHPELDPYTRHPSSFPVVAAIMGGIEHVRFSEFNFRETPAGAGLGSMNFHHDAVLADRLDREPYMPCDWLCALHYLTDVEYGNPTFCVVPRSRRYATLADALTGLGDGYREVPLRGTAGTCVLYDTATYHTRLDGDGEKARRTWHQYYARGGWLRSSLPGAPRYIRAPTPVLTDWNLFPERLAMSPDPDVRRFFSHWNTAQGEWAASGFDPAVREKMPRGYA